MGECTRQSIDKTEGMEQEEPVHPQSRTHCGTMILPTVDHVLSAAPAPSHALRLLEKNITEFLWNGADGNRRRPMVDRATLA